MINVYFIIVYQKKFDIIIISIILYNIILIFFIKFIFTLYFNMQPGCCYG